MKRKYPVLVAAALVLLLLLGSCDLFGGDDEEDDSGGAKERGPTVSWSGGTVAYGSTVALITAQTAIVSDPCVISFSVGINGDEEIGFWGINDITDQDDASYHRGNMSIDYTDQEGSFSLAPGETEAFTVTLAAGTVAGTYEMEIGILNKNDITPNPYIFRVRITVLES